MNDMSVDVAAIGDNKPEDATKKFFKQVRQLGAQQGLGADAKAKLYAATARAVQDGVISFDKDSEGHDAFHRIYDEYTKECSKQSQHSKKGKVANESKLRAVGKAAAKPSCDFLGTIDTMTKIKAEEDAAGNKMRAFDEAIVCAARAQQSQDDDLTDEQLREIISPAKGEDPTLKDRWEAARKIVDQLITGENKWGLKDQSPEAIAAQEAIETVLATFVLDEKKKELARLAAELGVQVAA